MRKLLALVSAAVTWTFVASANPKVESPTAPQLGQAKITSDADELLNFHCLTLLAGFDNMKGIYEVSLAQTLTTRLQKETRFDFKPAKEAIDFPIEEIALNHQRLKSLFEKTNCDAALHFSVVRGTEALTLTLTLILAKDRKSLLQVQTKSIQQMSVEELQTKALQLYEQLWKQLPFDGRVLSRNENHITLNIGSDQGLREGRTLSAVAIATLSRHPKKDFLVATDQALLGTIKIFKVEPALSFAEIVSEVRPGVIQTNTKIQGAYAAQTSLLSENDSGDLSAVDPTFGKKPQEWWPDATPSFGMIGGRFGLGTFQEKASLSSSGSLDSKSILYPSVALIAEGWLTPNWTIRARLNEGIASFNNPLASSLPSKTSVGISRYDLALVYRHSFLQDFFGPHVEAGLGLSHSAYRIDDTTPTSFTSLESSDVFLSLGGEFPLFPESPWSIGGRIYLHWNPSLNEKPVSSGSNSKNSFNEFSLYSMYYLRPSLRLVGSADFTLFSASLSGPGSRGESATTITVQDTSIRGGVDYLF